MTKLLKIGLLKLMLVASATIVSAVAVKAQDSLGASNGLDSLFYRDGRVEGVVISKSTQEVVEFTYPGESITNEAPKSYFSYIKYSSGRVEDVAANLALTSKKTASVKVKTPKEKKEKSERIVWYQGDVNFGYAICNKVYSKRTGSMETNFQRPIITTSHGVRITKWAFVGMGVGLQYAYGIFDSNDCTGIFRSIGYVRNNWETLILPVYLNVRGYCPISEKFDFYVSVNAGIDPLHYCFASNEDDFGTANHHSYYVKYYGEYGVGMNYRKLDFSFGILQQYLTVNVNTMSNLYYFRSLSFYCKIGVRF